MMTEGEQVIAISLFLNLVLSKIKEVKAQETQCLRVGNNILWVACNNDDNSRLLKSWLDKEGLTSVHLILDKIQSVDLTQLNQNSIIRDRNPERDRPTNFRSLSTISTLAGIVDDELAVMSDFRDIDDNPGTLIEHKIKRYTGKVPLANIVFITGNPPVETGISQVHAEQKLIYAYSIGSQHGTPGQVYLGGCKPPCGSCLKPVVYAVSRLGIKYASTDKIKRPRWSARQDNSGTMAIDAFAFDKFWNVNKDYWNEYVSILADKST
ncbi:hypothetical protein [Agaribacterium sp. ZY112]|uniref:hypothetical protein n=1 Tax=Agaribacterium sp. ZY112 TaxID=3233574 RepID=UPI003526B142